MSRELNEFEVFWQCPKCKHPNRAIANDVLLSLHSFKCKQCNVLYTLRKNITQVLCEPVNVRINYAG